MKNIAIIPARSGSKGLKDKNIRLLNGKPLLAYTIEAALKSKCFDTVMVSTDSKKYARIAKEYGAEVPFLRNENTSQDSTSPWDVMKEVLDMYKELGQEFDTFCLLQPTSPLRNAKDIRNAYMELEEKKANAVVSMCELECSMHLVNTLPKNLSMKGFISNEQYNKRRQDIKPYYRFNGAIYISKVKTFYKHMNIYDDKCYAYIMDRNRSYDIDDKDDLKIVEALIK
ncbi:MAG: acylneuraminate cytidylyltransferase family protein [Erysipelotrichaceae bacterium]|nr:acylneuraminate cytidylyltransferase family protein [Erysipelotrichaceae bacterium]